MKTKKRMMMTSPFKEAFGSSAVDFNNISCDLGDSFISTGSRTLNRIITGNPEIGIVRRRVYEIYGPEGCGKTTIALESIADCQKKGGYAMLIDAEHALDPSYAKSLGVNLEELNLGEPDCGEEGFEMLEWAIDNDVDLVVVDSVSALTPRSEVNGDLGDANMGALARLMGQGLRRATNKLTTGTKTSIIFINQLRIKIGVLFGNPETTSGGQALKFFSSVRLDMRSPRSDKRVESTVEVGKIINVKSIKNKIQPPFQRCKIYLRYGKGIESDKDLAQCLTDMKLAETNKGMKTITLDGFKRMNLSTFMNKVRKDKNFNKIVKGMLKGGKKNDE